MVRTQSCNCDDRAYFRDRAETLERQVREWEESRAEEARRRRQAARDEREERLRCPDGWPEAFAANRTLMSREIESVDSASDEQDANLIRRFNAGWQSDLAANDAAGAMYHNRMQALDKEYQRRKRQLLAEIAAEIEARFPNATVCSFLRDDDPVGYVNW